MTKSELFEVLANVPDDAEVYIMGADINIIVHSPDDNHVTLDEKGEPFKENAQAGYYRVLFDPYGDLAGVSNDPAENDEPRAGVLQ
jgi:hypothetical protein